MKRTILTRMSNMKRMILNKNVQHEMHDTLRDVHEKLRYFTRMSNMQLTIHYKNVQHETHNT
jgi:hypothetical protein